MRHEIAHTRLLNDRYVKAFSHSETVYGYTKAGRGTVKCRVTYSVVSYDYNHNAIESLSSFGLTTRSSCLKEFKRLSS